MVLTNGQALGGPEFPQGVPTGSLNPGSFLMVVHSPFCPRLFLKSRKGVWERPVCMLTVMSMLVSGSSPSTNKLTPTCSKKGGSLWPGRLQVLLLRLLWAVPVPPRDIGSPTIPEHLLRATRGPSHWGPRGPSHRASGQSGRQILNKGSKIVSNWEACWEGKERVGRIL